MGGYRPCQPPLRFVPEEKYALLNYYHFPTHYYNTLTIVGWEP
jgi:hypothetical protein